MSLHSVNGRIYAPATCVCDNISKDYRTCSELVHLSIGGGLILFSILLKNFNHGVICDIGCRMQWAKLCT